jgi:hypothetical protein
MFLAGCRSAQPTLPAPEDDPAPPASLEPTRPEPSPGVAEEPGPVVVVPQAELDPEPPPPEPFDGQSHVTVEELLAELEAIAVELEANAQVRGDYDAFVDAFELADGPQLYRDYVRVKLAFEATRDGGFWNLRWDITNEKPNSEQIWAQWAKLSDRTEFDGVATATAECDELSALFAFVARGLGVDRIGLFWPTWNHVVAVWTVPSPSDDDEAVRVVVPTSQIFLGARDTLGTHGFNPWKQKTIYTYKRRDVRKSHRVPVNVARFFVTRARQYAHRPQSELQALRNQRSEVLGGS